MSFLKSQKRFQQVTENYGSTFNLNFVDVGDFQRNSLFSISFSFLSLSSETCEYKIQKDRIRPTFTLMNF